MKGTGSTKLQLRRCAAEALFRANLVSIFQRRTDPPWRILTYHRITRPEDVSYPLQPGMYVTPETFRRQMEYLSQAANVVSLESLLGALESSRPIASKTVAVTIDDGWRDNYLNAFPVLRALGIPATIFLATSFIGSKQCFWTDAFVQALSALSKDRDSRPAVLDRLSLVSDCPVPVRALLKDFISGSADPVGTADSAVEMLKDMPRPARFEVVEGITRLAREFSQLPAARQFLNWDEVQEMNRSGISFASHSHHHENMIELSEDRLRDEVIESVQSLREHGLKPLNIFCYPGGYLNARTQHVLKEQGISFAFSTARSSDLEMSPKLLGRVGIHEDISSTTASFAARVWVRGF